ncbi:MAG: chromosomal replication initiator protein DnaA [Malacoplasma sp.]|nr:chromosomal replication initiator protein DnaA [Malacoplasma sp.]
MVNLSELKKTYSLIKKEIKKEFQNENFYSNYVLNSSILKVEDKNIYIIVENDFVKEVLNNEYKKTFQDYFVWKLQENIEVFFITSDEKINKKEQDLNTTKIKKTNNYLNPDLTFKNFLIGLFNENAYKASESLINQNNNWKTLLIYGGTGLGKTHLLHAIGNKFLKQNPDANVLYIQTEDFLEKIYNAISEGSKKIEEFKKTFDDIDLLLIDDIQFLNNKEKLNEIFFNIFNKLNKNNKLIVMSSDKVPNSLKIDDRMISRFNSGLSIKINQPDQESIKKIIVEKIKVMNVKNSFSNLAIEYIALRFNSDIRTLEGVLNKIAFYLLDSINSDEIVNEQKIKSVIEADSDYEIISNLINVNPAIIIENVSVAYGVDKKGIISKKQSKDFSFPRKICMYILREKLNLSYSEIGSLFSNRNHATVLEAVKNVKELLTKDKDLKVFIENLMQKF